MRSFQKLPKLLKVAKRSRKLLKVAKKITTDKLPKDDKSCKKMLKDAKS